MLQIIAGGITILIVPWALTEVEQGYYYTFGSILALQAFFELGLNYVVTQIAGHESARLNIDNIGNIQGDKRNASRLLSLITIVKRWYFFATPVFVVVIFIGGFYFFQQKNDLSIQNWIGPWILVVLFTGFNLYLSPQLAILEGIGRIGEVARLRMYQSLAGMLILWIGLSKGIGLWAVSSVSGVAALTTFVWLKYFGNLHTASDLSLNTDDLIDWRRDIYPMQWRIALSWIGGWIIWNSFTPMLFIHQGPSEAGRVGLALNIFMSITTLGTSWVNASLPSFLKYIALEQRMILNRLFLKTIASSMIFTSLLLIIFLVGVEILQTFNFVFAKRLAERPILFCLALVALANVFVSAAAVFMRAHKVEPMLSQTLTMGILVGLTSWVGSQYSSLTMILGYTFLGIFVGLPWTIILLLRFYKRN